MLLGPADGYVVFPVLLLMIFLMAPSTLAVCSSPKATRMLLATPMKPLELVAMAFMMAVALVASTVVFCTFSTVGKQWFTPQICSAKLPDF